MQNRQIRRGDIYYAELNPVVGSEQGDSRPVIIVSNDAGNNHSPTVIVTPMTGNLRKNPLPTHVVIPQTCGLGRDSLMLAEQIRTIDRVRLGEYIGHISDEIQPAVDTALTICILTQNTKKTAAGTHPRGRSYVYLFDCYLVYKLDHFLQYFC